MKKDIKKILITGGAGYIGNSFIHSLPESIEVIVIDNFVINTPYKQEINNLLSKKNITVINANVSQVEIYKHAIQNVDALIYMASLNSYKEANSNPLLYFNENNKAAQLLINVLKETSPDLQKIILTSTRGVYGEGAYLCNTCKMRVYPFLSEELTCTECASKNLQPAKLKETDLPNPSSYYGVTKRIQEDIIKMFSLQEHIELDIFRIFNVFGENQGKYYSHIGHKLLVESA